MIFFLDTEYNSYKGDLISLALVPLQIDLNPLYVELRLPQNIHPWVRQNVLPWLGNDRGVSTQEAQKQLQDYLAPYPNITIMVDYPADIYYCAKLLETGPGMTLDLGRVNFLWEPAISANKSLQPHHALADAIALRDCWIEGE